MPIKQNQDGTLEYSRPTRTWIGLLTQVGTATPTILEIENTFGSEITADRTGVGTYQLLGWESQLDANKTTVTIGTGNGAVIISAERGGVNVVDVGTRNGAGTQTDAILNKTVVEVTVYG